MRIYNKDKTQVLTEYDLNLGYLKRDTLIRHVDEIKSEPEKYHYVVTGVYKTGKSVVRVIDKPAVKAVPEHDEKEDIQVYIPYTIDELTEIENRKTLHKYEGWFNIYFDMQTKQHSWQTDYSPSYDSILCCEYKTWDKLCEKAQHIREEINRLRNLLK